MRTNGRPSPAADVDEEEEGPDPLDRPGRQGELDDEPGPPPRDEEERREEGDGDRRRDVPAAQEVRPEKERGEDHEDRAAEDGGA